MFSLNITPCRSCNTVLAYSSYDSKPKLMLMQIGKSKWINYNVWMCINFIYSVLYFLSTSGTANEKLRFRTVFYRISFGESLRLNESWIFFLRQLSLKSNSTDVTSELWLKRNIIFMCRECASFTLTILCHFGSLQFDACESKQRICRKRFYEVLDAPE